MNKSQFSTLRPKVILDSHSSESYVTYNWKWEANNSNQYFSNL